VKNLILIAIVIGLAVLPLVMLSDAEFTGADGEAEEAITEINVDYSPWFSPLLCSAMLNLRALMGKQKRPLLR